MSVIFSSVLRSKNLLNKDPVPKNVTFFTSWPFVHSL